MISERDIETALRFPWTSIGSDAGAVGRIGVPDATGLLTRAASAITSASSRDT